MEIYITGDLHGDLRRFQPEIFYEQEGLTKEDIVLVAGGPSLYYGFCDGQSRKLRCLTKISAGEMAGR